MSNQIRILASLIILSLNLNLFAFSSGLELVDSNWKTKKTNLELRVISLPFKQELYLSNWDLENNFTNLKVNDRIIAETKDQVDLNQQTVLPAGVKFYGFVSEIYQPKNFNRDGRIEISFYAIEDLTGKVFQFRREKQTVDSSIQKPNAIQKSTKIGQTSLAGSVTGGLVAYQVGASALSFFLSPQFLFAGAASLTGIGFLVGFVGSAASKGEESFLKPGDDLVVSLKNSFILPAAQKTTQKTNLQANLRLSDSSSQVKNAFKVEILEQVLVKDDFGQPVLVLSLKINNQTNSLVSGSSFSLSNSYKSQINSTSGVGLKKKDFYQDLSMKRIEPGKTVQGQLVFELDMPGIEHFLIVKNYYQQKLIFSQSIGYPKEHQEKSKFTRFRENLKSKFKKQKS